MYLLDTNIFLEGLLEQKQSDEVRQLFTTLPIESLYITDLSLHSIGIILFKLEEYDLFADFLQDIILEGVGLLTLNPSEFHQMKESAQSFGLDFDDTYQYTVAVINNLTLVTFDKNFKKTDRPVKSPLEILS